MRNQFVVVFFILTANILSLVHAVIPHHHHHQQVCIEVSHCQNDHASHRHGTPSTEHNHDENPTSPCVLQQVAILPVNSEKHEMACELSCTDHHSHNYFFILLFAQAEQPIPAITALTAPPDLVSSYHGFIPLSSGLRAPPSVYLFLNFKPFQRNTSVLR